MRERRDEEKDSTARTVPLFCSACGRDVTLTYQPADTFRLVRWSCPYTNCGHDHDLDLHGVLVRVDREPA